MKELWNLHADVDPPRRELAAALRALSERCVRTGADPIALSTAAGLVRDALALLPDGPTAHDAFVDGSYFDDPVKWIDRGALMGRANPVAPPMHITPDSACEIVLDERYAGAPGMVHGGIIAALYDQLCGHVVVMAELSGFTGELRVRYRKRTPLYATLRLEGRLASVEGRRIEVHGRCTHDGVLLSECEAVFVALPREAAQAVIRGA